MVGLQFLNNYRGIAILLVLLSHAKGFIPKTEDTFALNFIRIIVTDCTSIFIVLAGYFFRVLMPTFEYKKFITNKFRFVILPYLFLSIPIILMYVTGFKTYHQWIDMEWFSSLNPLQQILFFIFTGSHLGPLWFVPVIALFYVLSSVLVYCDKKNLIPLIFVLSLVPALYFGRPENNTNEIQSFIFFLPAYLLGMILAQREWIYKKIAPYSAVLICFTLAIMYYFHYDVIHNSSVDLPFKLVLTIFGMGFCYQYLNTRNVVLDLFARLSFFLFFIHGYFTGFVRTILLKVGTNCQGIFPVLLIFIGTIAFSLMAYVLLKLIFKKRSKLLIGG